MSFVNSIKASKSDLVYLVRAEDKPTGRDAWYYVQVHSKAKLPIFLEKVKTGLTLTDYADILYRGWGTEPPQEVKDKIKEQFG